MLDATELLDVARVLMTGQSPTDAEPRRAVSSLYYALFHTVLHEAAQHFIGPGRERSAAYTIFYRSFDHSHMKTVCEALQVSMLKDRYKKVLKRNAVGQEVQNFARAFSEFQELRHYADYDPIVRFLRADVMALIDEAIVAIAAFNAAPPDERTDVLALMMVRARP